jgi:hypothetical protein
MGEDKGEGEIEFAPFTPALSHKGRRIHPEGENLSI